jgi:hypothetical protein
MEKTVELIIFSENGKYEKKLKNISVEDIIKIMQTLDWNFFQQLMLKKDENDWLEVSGNLGEDGLACLFQENDDVHVIDEPPVSVEHMTRILISYFQEDDRLKEKNSFETYGKKLHFKKVPKEHLDTWRKNFITKNKEEKKALIRLRLSMRSYFQQ